MKVLKVLFMCFTVLSFFSIAANGAPYKAEDTFSDTKPLVLMDFDNSKVDMNNVGGSWGGMDANPNDKEAYIKTKYFKDIDLHKDGFNLKISYSVQSSLPAFNGIWTKLNELNLKDFQAISINVKGDAEKGFNDSFKIEIKDKSTKITSTVEDITAEWKKITIPFDQFEGDLEGIDMSKIMELTFVFEDWKFKQKVGSFYIDDVSFITKKGITVKYGDLRSIGKKTGAVAPAGTPAAAPKK